MIIINLVYMAQFDTNGTLTANSNWQGGRRFFFFFWSSHTNDVTLVLYKVNSAELPLLDTRKGNSAEFTLYKQALRH